jgi:hypothetical protein
MKITTLCAALAGPDHPADQLPYHDRLESGFCVLDWVDFVGSAATDFPVYRIVTDRSASCLDRLTWTAP